MNLLKKVIYRDFGNILFLGRRSLFYSFARMLVATPDSFSR